MVTGRGGKGLPSNLLSDYVCIVRGLDFEAAVVRPQVDGCTDTGDAAFIDLRARQHTSLLSRIVLYVSHHLSRLRSCDRELEVGILLPIPEEEREAG